ncbi:octopamine receptor beta-1R-like [Artemia franciscana]|uniref:octopamine receptor beta-1R-like n=1 Tax=Artemia franciscana TaxID=6661 RepID=UPI0032D9E14B
MNETELIVINIQGHLYFPFSTSDPLLRYTFVKCSRLFGITFGILLNCIVCIVIIVSKHLKAPMHAFWFGTCFASIGVLLGQGFETFSRLLDWEVLCLIYMSNNWAPYSYLTFTLASASIDTWYAIKHPFKHIVYVTKKRVFVFILTFFVIHYILAQLPYITGMQQLQCEYSLRRGRIGSIIGFISALISAIFYMKSHKIAKLSTQYDKKRKRFWPRNRVDSLHSNSYANTTSTGVTEGSQDMLHPQHINKTQREGLRASKTILLAIIPYWVYVINLLLCGIINRRCFLYLECRYIYNIIMFQRENLIIHAIYNPILYIYRNKAFRKAVRKLFGQNAVESEKGILVK